MKRWVHSNSVAQQCGPDIKQGKSVVRISCEGAYGYLQIEGPDGEAEIKLDWSRLSVLKDAAAEAMIRISAELPIR
jgi:hypothetical protein